MREGPAVLIPADIRFPLERANGVQIVKTAAALARAGARTTLIVRHSDDRPTAEILEGYGVSPDARLTVRRLSVLHRRGSFALPRASFLLRAWVSLLRRPPGAVVFTRDLQLADLLLRLPGRPRLVYEAHAVESLLYAERGAIYGTAERPRPRKAARIAARERRVWRRAAAIVTTTAGIRDSFAGLHGTRARARVIPNGCDVPSDRRFPGLARADGRRILYAGQLYPWKGVDVLVQAMARLPQARLVILGGIEGEPDAARIRALVDALGLGERVEMPGHVGPARVAEELGRASVVAVPFLKTAMTERHTSPLKAFEAMAAGRPLVASDLPSSREFLRDGVNALLVPPGDPAALADAASRLLADPCLAERIARAAWDESPAYSWDARGEKLLELMSELP
ncbi:MAG TPA: glycosyltransferase [Vicinamibacteria bacterium]|nr:glycosyltransferase [Vicinamibacteria bacterium]